MKTWVLAVLGTISLLGADSLAVQAKVHTVKSGDWVSTIATQYNIPWSSIYALNAQTIGENPDKIYPDTTLYIPLSTEYVSPKAALLPTYYIEIWIFLLLFALFIWIHNKKEWGSGAPIEVKIDQKPVEVKVSGEVAPSESTTSRGEIEIENLKGTSVWLHENAKSEGNAEDVDTSLDNKSDLKKLKKLRVS